MNHSKNGRILKKEDFSRIKTNISIDVLFIGLNINNLVFTNKKLLTRKDIISPHLPWKLPFSKFSNYRKIIKFVIIDDGIGSYESIFYWIRLQYSQSRTIKYISRYIIKYFDYYISRVICPSYYTIFSVMRRKKNLILVNENVVVYYRNVIKRLTNIEFSNSIIYKSPVIFYTQPYKFGKDIDKGKYFEILNKIQIWANKKGKEFIIKLHPRDNNVGLYKSRGYTIFDLNITGDDIIFSDNYRNSVIVGITSTVLINHYIMGGNSKVYSLCREDIYLSKELRKFCKRFYKKYCGIIKTMDSLY
ncbi:alpha-2,8-polysialyltransferase family protein [Mycoplasmatota bacterium]|nr:alpha-2,8-polysialyltransferase family protein [Mycoplasmatota bacterium]